MDIFVENLISILQSYEALSYDIVVNTWFYYGINRLGDDLEGIKIYTFQWQICPSYLLGILGSSSLQFVCKFIFSLEYYIICKWWCTSPLQIFNSNCSSKIFSPWTATCVEKVAFLNIGLYYLSVESIS